MKAQRPWAWPLVPFYAGALALKDRMRASGVLARKRLRLPVISVGSLSAGGAGKTPLVMSLASMLAERGWAVDVLSRGYGREDHAVGRVVLPRDEAGMADISGLADDADLPVNLAEASRRFGDEPVLIAGRTGLPVWVGADRFDAGSAAEKLRFAHAPSPPNAEAAADDHASENAGEPYAIHILDDGFQHRTLYRDFDLVLLTAADLEDVLLPAGNLREPLSALLRADAVALREEEADETLPVLRPFLREGTPIWTIRRTLHFPAPLGVFGAGLRPLALCALARPDNFVRGLRRAGCGVVDAVIYPDHHRYRMADVRDIVAFAASLNATGLVTTEKDAVKFSPELRSRLEREIGPLMVVELRSEFVFKSPVLRFLESRLNTPVEARAERKAHAS